MIDHLTPTSVSFEKRRDALLGLIALLVGVLDDHQATGLQERRSSVDGTADDIEPILTAIERESRIVLAHLGIPHASAGWDIRGIHRDHGHIAAQASERTTSRRADARIGLNHVNAAPSVSQRSC
jgi:hypothetical protein